MLVHLAQFLRVLRIDPGGLHRRQRGQELIGDLVPVPPGGDHDSRELTCRPLLVLERAGEDQIRGRHLGRVAQHLRLPADVQAHVEPVGRPRRREAGPAIAALVQGEDAVQDLQEEAGAVQGGQRGGVRDEVVEDGDGHRHLEVVLLAILLEPLAKLLPCEVEDPDRRRAR